MIRSYRYFLPLVFAGTGLAPLTTVLASSYMQTGVFPWTNLPRYFLTALAVVAA